MSWGYEKLSIIAPSKPLKHPVISNSEKVWMLNLDMVEANSGQVIDKQKSPLSTAGSSTHWFDTSHVLYSKLRPYLNKVVMPDEEGLATTELVPLKPDSKRLDRAYLTYYLRSKTFVDWISEQVAGAKMPRVSMNVFWNHEIPIPFPDDPAKSLAEQKRIAAILDKADAIRRKRKQAIQLADDFLRAVFLDMFGDPVTNPKGWEVKSMKNLIAIQGGYAFKSGDFGKVGIPVVKIGNANKLGFTTKGFSFIEPENPDVLRKYELYAGDLLMSLTGTVGKDDYANVTEVTNEYEMYYLNQRVAKITVNESEISKNYLKFFLSEPQIKGEITKNNRGVRQANIGNADIYSLNVPIPSLRDLVKFDSIVKQVNKMSFNTEKAPEYSNAFFNTLSQKAFAGEL